MKGDFKTLANRKNSGSKKWIFMERENSKIDDHTVPLTVADMEFLMARELVDSLKSFIEENTLGYMLPQDSYFEALMTWMERRNSYKIEKDWIIPTPGVKPGFTASLRALAKEGDGVIINLPSYGPMVEAIEDSKLKLVNIPLINKDMHYEFDFEGFEKACKDPKNKIFLFCSPHNPTGRVFTYDELKRISDICLKNDIIIISDEIWSDFIRPGFKYIPIASISKETEDITITCHSASKTFNIAGLACANLIIKNKDLREKVRCELHHMRADVVNGLGLLATETAYRKCEYWLDELIEVLEENRKIGEEFFKKHDLPVTRAEGTYLLWVDFSKLGMDNEKLKEFLQGEGSFYASDGLSFGKEGNCYRRINMALPSRDFKVQLDMLEKALMRIKN